MYEHPRGGKNNFGDAKNGPPDSYMYFMNQIKVTGVNQLKNSLYIYNLMILTFGPSKVIFSTSRVFTRTFGMILSILYFDTTQNFPKMASFL